MQGSYTKSQGYLQLTSLYFNIAVRFCSVLYQAFLVQGTSARPDALQIAEAASPEARGEAEGNAEQTWNSRMASPLPSPQKQLLAELMEASRYLQGLNARLDAERESDANG